MIIDYTRLRGHRFAIDYLDCWFGILAIRILNLFRISILGFRIWWGTYGTGKPPPYDYDSGWAELLRSFGTQRFVAAGIYGMDKGLKDLPLLNSQFDQTGITITLPTVFCVCAAN